MSGGISLPAALQLLDGTPHKKAPSAIFENLPLAKVLQGGNMSGLLKQVMTDGNLGSVLANPMAAVTGQLQRQIGQAATQLQSALGSGASGLISSLTGQSGLGATVSQFQVAGDNLSGVSNGQTGLFALAGHDSLLGMLGDAAPAAVALSRVLGPTASGDLLTGISAGLLGTISAVIGGTMSVGDATVWVQQQAASIAAVTAASADALAQGQAIQMQASAVTTVSGLLAPTGADATVRSPFQVALATFVTPAALAAMDAANVAQAAQVMPTPIDVAGMTSLDG